MNSNAVINLESLRLKCIRNAQDCPEGSAGWIWWRGQARRYAEARQDEINAVQNEPETQIGPIYSLASVLSSFSTTALDYTCKILTIIAVIGFVVLLLR